VTETFKKNFIQRFLGRTVSIDGNRKYVRVTQRGTQEHPVEGLKRYFVTLAIEAKPGVTDAVFSPAWDAASPTGVKGVTRRHLDVPERPSADGVAVTVAVVRRLKDGGHTRVEFDDSVDGLVVLKRQIVKGIWRYPLTLYGLQMNKGCWDVTNVVPQLHARRTTGEVELISFANVSEAISFAALIASGAQQPGSSVELKELDKDGKETSAKYIFGFSEGPDKGVSFGRIPQARRAECLTSLKPFVHRSANK
jgi:hypothetical protein